MTINVLLRVLILSLALLVVGPFEGPQAQDPSTIKVPNEDPEMGAAKANARATLAKFWRAYENPGPGERDFALKVALPFAQNNTEHIWVSDIQRDGSSVSGVINNVPRDVKTLRLGQRIQIRDEQISDWMYLREGKIVGNHTLRPLLKRMPPAEAARYRVMLAED